MKKGISSRMAIVTMAAAAILIMPTLALSTTLTLISEYSYESTSQTGPPDTIDQIANFLGYYPNLIGPGGALTGVTLWGTNTKAVASASSMQVVAWYAVWQWGRTQTAIDKFYWAARYQLNGDPGVSADISLNYTYDNSRLNLAFDGRSESKSAAAFFSAIVPASETGNYGTVEDMLNFWVFLHCPYQMSLSYDQNYPFAAVTWADDTATGSFPLGSMEAGDQLHFFGAFSAESQAQAYWAGVTIATMVSSLETNLVINENPPSAVPEPTTILLLGFGLIGLTGYGRKKFFKK